MVQQIVFSNVLIEKLPHCGVTFRSFAFTVSRYESAAGHLSFRRVKLSASQSFILMILLISLKFQMLNMQIIDILAHTANVK